MDLPQNVYVALNEFKPFRRGDEMNKVPYMRDNFGLLRRILLDYDLSSGRVQLAMYMKGVIKVSPRPITMISASMRLDCARVSI